MYSNRIMMLGLYLALKFLKRKEKKRKRNWEIGERKEEPSASSLSKKWLF